jgi:GNAT superfamily N-acetyltransferase
MAFTMEQLQVELAKVRAADPEEATIVCVAPTEGKNDGSGKKARCGKRHRKCEIEWLKGQILAKFGKKQAGPTARCTDYLCAVLTGAKPPPCTDRVHRAHTKEMTTAHRCSNGEQVVHEIDVLVMKRLEEDLEAAYREFAQGQRTGFALGEPLLSELAGKLMEEHPMIRGYLGGCDLVQRVAHVHAQKLAMLEDERSEGVTVLPESGAENARGAEVIVSATRDDEAYVRLAAKCTGLLLQTLPYDAIHMLASDELKNIDWILAMDTATETLLGAVGYRESEVKVLTALQRGTGIGKALLTSAMRHMGGYTKALQVDSAKCAAAFFQRFGFRECDENQSASSWLMKMQRDPAPVRLDETDGVTLIKYERGDWGEDPILACVNDVASSERMLAVYRDVVNENEMGALEKAVRNRESVAVELDLDYMLRNGTFPGLGARLVMYEEEDGGKVAGTIEVQLKQLSSWQTIVEATAGRVYREEPKDAEDVLCTMVHYLIATVMDYDDGTDCKGGVRKYEKIVEILSGRVWYGLTKESANTLKFSKAHRERFNKYAEAEARAHVKVCGERPGQTSKILFQNMEWEHLENPAASYSFGNIVFAWFENSENVCVARTNMPRDTNRQAERTDNERAQGEAIDLTLEHELSDKDIQIEFVRQRHRDYEAEARQLRIRADEAEANARREQDKLKQLTDEKECMKRALAEFEQAKESVKAAKAREEAAKRAIESCQAVAAKRRRQYEIQ